MSFLRSIIIASALLVFILWSILLNEGLFALSEKGTADTGVNHALIIGISNYAHWEKLQSPSKDAAEIAKILTEKYDFEKKSVVFSMTRQKKNPRQRTFSPIFQNIQVS